MTYFADLSLIRYHSGPYDHLEWNCPLLAVGWLENQYELTKGGAPHGLIQRIEYIRPIFREGFFQYVFRGLHKCTLCKDPEWRLEYSSVNLFIPGKDCVYLAPGAIDHHITKHGYLPPQGFIDAVESCPIPGSPDYMRRLRELNDGDAPPLELKALGIERLQKYINPT